MTPKTKTNCCKCGEPITGFVSHKDQSGDWCEDCLNLFTCESCGNIEDKILDGGLCESCEIEHGE